VPGLFGQVRHDRRDDAQNPSRDLVDGRLGAASCSRVPRLAVQPEEVKTTN
jgi:hypothetical protein